MPSANFEKYQAYVTDGKWSNRMLHTAVERGEITAEEYKTITKEDYVPIVYSNDAGLLTALSEQGLISGGSSTNNGSESEDTNTESSDGESGGDDSGDGDDPVEPVDTVPDAPNNDGGQ